MNIKDEILIQAKKLNDAKAAKEQVLKDAWKPYHDIILELSPLIKDGYTLLEDSVLMGDSWTLFAVRQRGSKLVFKYDGWCTSKVFTKEEFDKEFPKLIAPFLKNPEEAKTEISIWEKWKNKLTKFIFGVK